MKITTTALKTTFLAGLLTLSTQSFAMNSDDLNDYISDYAISASIKTRLLTNAAFNKQNIKVSTKDGIVSFTGRVDTLVNASILIQAATSAHGVKGINASKLTVANIDAPLDDMIITAEVRGLIYRYDVFGKVPVLSPLPISISTENGAVTISSETATAEQIDRTVRLAQSIYGVKSVDVESTVSDDNATT